MRTSEIFKGWGKILKGERPSLSIEITKECPLRCPGCYAYHEGHLGGGVTLRGLSDRTGQALVDGVLGVVDRLKPLHLSLVGGDPWFDIANSRRWFLCCSREGFMCRW